MTDQKKETFEGIFMEKSEAETRAAIFELVTGLVLVAIAFGLALIPSVPSILWHAVSSIGSLRAIYAVSKLKKPPKLYLIADSEGVSFRHKKRSEVKLAVGEIEFVTCTNLTLVLRSRAGKRYEISGLTNSYEACSFIRRLMDEVSSPRDATVVLGDLVRAKRMRNIGIGAMILGFAAMFGSIFIAVEATNEKEIADFTPEEFRYFIGFLVVFALIIAVIFAVCCTMGIHAKAISDYTDEFHRSAMKSTEFSVNCTGVIYGFDYRSRIKQFYDPMMNEYSYTVELFVRDNVLATIYTKGNFQTEEEMYEDMEKNFGEILDWQAE